MYSMLTDTVWLGLETSEDLKFWATTKPAQTNEPDKACEKAEIFNWDDGVVLKKDTTVWYKINMEEVRKKAAKFPTVFVQNLSTDAACEQTYNQNQSQEYCDGLFHNCASNCLFA